MYAFLAVSARVLGPERYAALSALWALVFLVGPGVFFPIEQEVSRAVASRSAAGIGAGPVLRRAAAAAAGLATSMAALAVVFQRPLLDKVFDHQALVLAGFLVSLFGYASMHLARGALSGMARFGSYAVLLGAEGVLRLGIALGLLALGVRTAGPLGLLVGVTPFLALAVVLGRERDLMAPGPDAPWKELSRSLGYLLAGSLVAQVLIHGGPLAVKLLAGEQANDLTGRFFAGLLLARVPLFLFLAVQAALLPRLAGCAAQGDRAGFCATLGRLLALVAIISVVSVAGAFLLGRLALEVLFGGKFLMDGRGIALLAASSSAIMAAQALGQALVALEGQAAAATCWLVGAAVFAVVTAIGNDPLLRVELGLFAGSTAAAAAMGALLPFHLTKSFSRDLATQNGLRRTLEASP